MVYSGGKKIKQMTMTFLFTTRLKIISMASLFIIIISLVLVGYELGWHSAISAYEKEKNSVTVNPNKADSNRDNMSRESKI